MEILPLGFLINNSDSVHLWGKNFSAMHLSALGKHEFIEPGDTAVKQAVLHMFSQGGGRLRFVLVSILDDLLEVISLIQSSLKSIVVNLESDPVRKNHADFHIRFMFITINARSEPYLRLQSNSGELPGVALNLLLCAPSINSA